MKLLELEQMFKINIIFVSTFTRTSFKCWWVHHFYMLFTICLYSIIWMNYLTLILTTDTIRHNYNSLTHSVWINNYKKDGWCIFCMWHKNIYNTCKFSCIVCFTLWLGYLANSYIRYFKYKNNDESKNYLLLQICLH